MVREENRCVDCGKPCMGSMCPYRHVKILECDKCGEEVDKLYKYDYQELCKDCVIEELEVIM